MKINKVREFLKNKDKRKKTVTTGARFLPAVCAVAIAATVITTYDASIPDLLSSDVTVNAKEVGTSTTKKAESVELVELEPVEQPEEIEVETVEESGVYADGTYIGTGKGYQDGTVTAQVVIAGGAMTSIEVISCQYDGESYMNSAKSLINLMLASQTTNVDAVSGATYSCRGLIEAVRNALSQASNGAVAETPTETIVLDEETVEKIAKIVEKSSDGYEDGTYYGTGKGFQDGTIKVKVVIKYGKMKSIKIESYEYDGEEYIAMVKTLITEMIKKQTTNVDVVSGATYSSNGLISAVRDALSQAGKESETKKNESTKTETTETKNPTTEVTLPEQVDTSNGLIDGIYIGTGSGFVTRPSQTGEIKAEVEIKDGKIVSITIVSCKYDTDPYLSNAKTLLLLMIKQQNTDVDVVSGATYSSVGIIEAVTDALKQAAKGADASTDNTNKEDQTTDNTGNGTTNGDGTEDAVTGQVLKYEGSAVCKVYNYPIYVRVTVTGEKITAIELLTHESGMNAGFTEDAADGWGKYTGVFTQIVEKNSTENIDAVSQCTYSSDALVEAVKNALASEPLTESALENESESNGEQPSDEVPAQ